jgi:hypothetical protein
MVVLTEHNGKRKVKRNAHSKRTMLLETDLKIYVCYREGGLHENDWGTMQLVRPDTSA